MKIRISKLRRLIKEECRRVLEEQYGGYGESHSETTTLYRSSPPPKEPDPVVTHPPHDTHDQARARYEAIMAKPKSHDFETRFGAWRDLRDAHTRDRHYAQGEYNVRPGDTIWDISQREAVPIEQLIYLNQGRTLHGRDVPLGDERGVPHNPRWRYRFDPDLIYPGQAIHLPPDASSVVRASKWTREQPAWEPERPYIEYPGPQPRRFAHEEAFAIARQEVRDALACARGSCNL